MNRYYFTHVTSRSLKLDSSFRWVSNISFLTKNHFCEIQVFLTRCSTLSKSLFFHGCPTTEIWTEKRRKRERERKRERRREGGRRAGNLQRELSRFCEMRRKHFFSLSLSSSSQSPESTTAGKTSLPWMDCQMVRTQREEKISSHRNFGRLRAETFRPT